jgi:hypothetical protein
MTQTATVLQFPAPCRETMQQHVEHLFGGDLNGHHEGKIELAWTTSTPDKSGRHRLSSAKLFPTDKLDELVDEAIGFNSIQGVNVYIGAWLRHPHTAPFGRCTDKDAWALTAAYVDLDDDGTTKAAKEKYGSDKPTFVTLTGTEPHGRAQLWWKLREPVTDHAQGEALIRGMSQALGGDETVCNPGRVMRLAGSIAWPHKPGRVTEKTERVPVKEPGAPTFRAEQLQQKFPLKVVAAPALDPAQPERELPQRPASSALADLGKLDDGREEYMRDTVLACLVEFVGTNGAEPTADDLYEMAWPQFERNVSFRREGRGPEEMIEKCKYIVRRFRDGRLSGLEDIDKVVAAYQRKQETRTAAVPRHEPPIVPPKGIRTVDFHTLMTEQVEEEPDYIEDNLAGPGNFLLIAGPPKAQKSFLLQEMLVAGATGKPFLAGTFTTPRPLRIFYLQAEMNRKLLRKRARAFSMFTSDDRELLRSNLIISERFHMILNPDGVKVAIETIKQAFPNEPPDIIAVDPLANVFDEEKENDNTAMMRFLTGRLEPIRQIINPLACLVVVHHATKAKQEDMQRDPFACIRGAGSLRGYYDAAIVIYRKSEESKHRKVHFELRSGESPEPMTVELDSGRFKKVDPLSEIEMDLARKILARIEQAWDSGTPLSDKVQTRNEGRYAVLELSREFKIPGESIQLLLTEWHRNKIITTAIADSDAKLKGLKVLGHV